ncbi:unnamed protein product [Phyllotreta striolata]|uniref:Multidrug resistance-associated protein lethal(2)03659 n=1 Tax=Phyllotreta striolata TaxID=444603 RepID=A0A9N9XK50_PHYSR|nr:unnamed protein product [Phyllotreta striolata]
MTETLMKVLPIRSMLHLGKKCSLITTCMWLLNYLFQFTPVEMDEFKEDYPERKKNPLDNANLLSSIFFCWLLPFFVKGYKTDLSEEDIYEHRRSHDSEMLGRKLEAEWEKQVAKGDNPSLIKAIANVFILELVLFNLVVIIHEIIRMSQPFLITKLIRVYERNKIEEDKNEIYLYACIIVLTSFLNSCTSHNFNLGLMQLGMKLRVASCSLIYRKALRLSKSAVAETTIGQMVNLLSNDVGRFDYAVYFAHNLYIGPIETTLVMYLLYTGVGWTALSGAVLLLLSIPVQSWLGKKTSQYRLQTALRTDERIRLMNEIIAGIQVIKMYTWEYPFAKLVEFVRTKEMEYIHYISLIRAILMSCILTLNRCAIAICILVFVLTNHPLTAAYAYTVTSYYRLLNNVTNFFPTAVSQAAEIYISIKRIQTFLCYDEIQLEPKITTSLLSEHMYLLPGSPNLPDANNVPSANSPFAEMNIKEMISSIRIKNASAKWLKCVPDNNLDNITVDVKAGNMIAVVGPVGSGKTTLLYIIMKELELVDGSVSVDGVVSYASQEPWLFGGSVRQNILFGQKFDQTKYDEVVRVCALQRDFALFPHGDRTSVGERGDALSGGQRARINLARAVYKEADIYLLDDPLSAVDAHVGKQLFDDCICDYLGSKCVVLITHQLQYLKKVKRILLLNDGKIQAAGSYSDLRRANTDYCKLLTDVDEEEEVVRQRSRISVARDEPTSNFTMQEMRKEEMRTGKISRKVYGNYIRAGGSAFTGIGLIFAFILSQILESCSEYYVTIWVNIQQMEARANNSQKSQPTNWKSQSVPYKDRWFSSIFNSDLVSLYYGILVFMLVVIVLCRSLAFFSWCLEASTKLHSRMFNNIIYGPMRFFHTNPSGRILNRFSKDIGTLDESLPMALLDTIQIGIYVAAITLVIGSLTIWIIVPTVFIAILFYLMKIVFVRTSRDIKRIESVTRSPIFTHIAASLQGLTTIRAFKAQEIVKKEFDNYQNINSAAFFLYVAANRTFGFWLDFVCIIYIALVFITLIFIKSETFGGNIGLALTQTTALTGMFQWGMRQWSEFENQMTSVERVEEYANMKREVDDEAKEPEETWPEKGRVEFRNVTLRYSPEEPRVLKDVNFTAEPNEKVGIVGRTGAGKSSLIQALFRLAPIEGAILIDGIDTKTMPLNRVRSNISIIPQEPVLFSGTLRKNLDPFDEYTDEVLWNALKEVELKHTVDELQSGLDSKMAEGGSNFSVGQRQLVCLARAIIRNNKILILDEATANVDPHTDSLIQHTIRKKFANCTVLTIAHRLHTIMDSDKVLVMEAGRAVEFDRPWKLLENETGLFSSLVMQTGKATARFLKDIAESGKTKGPIEVLVE